MFKFISWLFILVGGGFLLFGGYQLYDSYSNEKNRLNEAQSIISQAIVTAEEKVDYSDIYDSISQGETVGVLYIPRLEREIPIIEVTEVEEDRKSTRLNSSHVSISYAVFCLKKKKINNYVLNKK